MTAAVIGTPQVITFTNNTPSGTYTIGGGATHVAALIASSGQTGSISTLTLGGTGLTQKIHTDDGIAGFSDEWYLGGSPTGSSLALAQTGISANNNMAATLFSVSGVSNPTNTAFQIYTGTTLLTATVTCAVGDLLLAVAGSNRGAVAMNAFGNSFTTVNETQLPGSSGRQSAGWKIATSTSETCSIETNTNSGGGSLSVVVFPALAGGSSAKLLTMISNQAGF